MMDSSEVPGAPGCESLTKTLQRVMDLYLARGAVLAGSTGMPWFTFSLTCSECPMCEKCTSLPALDSEEIRCTITVTTRISLQVYADTGLRVT